MKTLTFRVMLLACLLMAGVAFAQTHTPTPEATVEAPLTEHTRVFEARYEQFEYSIEHYSIHLDCTNSVGDQPTMYPGIIDITPNDLVLYGPGNGSIPHIKVAVTDVADDLELDPSILGEGPIIQYVNEVVREDRVQEIELSGVDALRVNDLPIGQAGVSKHIVALHNGLRYDIIAEPRSGESDFGDALFEAFLDSFEIIEVNE